MRKAQSDHELALRLRRGDSAALNAVLETHWTPLVDYVASLGVDRDTAEDVVQQTFVRLWERRKALKVEGSLCGLLFRIARNLCFDGCRRRKAHERAVRSSVDLVVSQTPHEDFVRREFQSILEAAIDALPQRRREVFLLVRHHGFSHREVADALDLAPQTVANHLGLALADLRVALAPYLPDYRSNILAEGSSKNVRAVGAAAR
jgi:RNA polymerase sigma-70 factor (ECF subfamily)